MGVCDIFSIVLSPFVRFPSARLGILVISICDIICDIEVLHITGYFFMLYRPSVHRLRPYLSVGHRCQIRAPSHT